MDDVLHGALSFEPHEPQVLDDDDGNGALPPQLPLGNGRYDGNGAV